MVEVIRVYKWLSLVQINDYRERARYMAELRGTELFGAKLLRCVFNTDNANDSNGPARMFWYRSLPPAIAAAGSELPPRPSAIQVLRNYVFAVPEVPQTLEEADAIANMSTPERVVTSAQLVSIRSEIVRRRAALLAQHLREEGLAARPPTPNGLWRCRNSSDKLDELHASCETPGAMTYKATWIPGQ